MGVALSVCGVNFENMDICVAAGARRSGDPANICPAERGFARKNQPVVGENDIGMGI